MNNPIFVKIVQNLKGKGYDIQENIDFNDLTFLFVGHTAPLQASKFGKNDYFVVGYEMQNPTINDIRDFSSQVFDFAKVTVQISYCRVYLAVIGRYLLLLLVILVKRY